MEDKEVITNKYTGDSEELEFVGIIESKEPKKTIQQSKVEADAID